MDDDEDNGQVRLRAAKSNYMYPRRAVNYHGTGMTKKLQKLRDVNPYNSERAASYRRFGLLFSGTITPE
jgi:hypothetical protein